VVRQVSKPCLVFKIFAAGRRCWSPAAIEGAFTFAYGSIKPIDAVIVGMFPRYKDQIAENAQFARKHGGPTGPAGA
jgi:DNA-binding MurR/RpiR family transcriptional regulator